MPRRVAKTSRSQEVPVANTVTVVSGSIRSGDDDNALAVKSVLSILENRELVVVGEGADLFVEPVPTALAGKSLAESAIGAKTGLNVIAIQLGSETQTNPQATLELPGDGELVMLGTAAQHRAFTKLFVS